MFAYTVACEFEDPQVAEEWIAWLRDTHLRDVCAAGAVDAELVRLDGVPTRCEVRYHFTDRAAFEAYEAECAPRLREEGLRRFPTERGLQYSRRTGTVRVRFPTEPGDAD